MLLFFTILSRLGYLNLLGVSIVLTNSMEPALRPYDMAIYANLNYTIGDVVVYCITPSHCFVHRVVGFITLDTLNGYKTKVVTKGDKALAPDSPAELNWIRGRVFLSVPWELWIPMSLTFLAYTIYGLAKTPIVGYSYVLLFTVGLASIVAVFGVVPRPIETDMVKPPVVNLAGVYFDQKTCTVSIRYTGEPSLTGVAVKANSTDVDVVVLHARELVFKPSPNLLREAFENGKPLLIAVSASLNRVGRMLGEYALLIGGVDPSITSINSITLVKNHNCFPITVNISIRYLSNGTWLWSNQTYIIEGFSYIMIEPLERAESAYAYIYWLNQGDARWIGLLLRRS